MISHARQVNGERAVECSENLATIAAGRQLPDALAEDQFYIDNGVDLTTSKLSTAVVLE